MPDSGQLRPTRRVSYRTLVTTALGALPLIALALAAPTAAAQRDTIPQPAPAHDPFRFEMMGPAEGGRVAAIAGVPGDARTWYIGNASGGVWKSSDSGATFRPVFD